MSHRAALAAPPDLLALLDRAWQKAQLEWLDQCVDEPIQGNGGWDSGGVMGARMQSLPNSECACRCATRSVFADRAPCLLSYLQVGQSTSRVVPLHLVNQEQASTFWGPVIMHL